MKDLIEALTILSKYMSEDVFSPTHCEHDTLWIVGVTKDDVSKKDLKRLKELGIFWSNDHDSFISFRFGSA